jgi:hypothetical protein
MPIKMLTQTIPERRKPNFAKFSVIVGESFSLLAVFFRFRISSVAAKPLKNPIVSANSTFKQFTTANATATPQAAIDNFQPKE